MRTRYLLSGIAASALLMSPALAQQNPPATTAPAATTTTTQTMNAPTPMGTWRASKLIGLNVYNQANESIGEINELLLDKSGRVAGVIIGVGGFLGMGERHVMVTMDKLTFKDDARTTTGTASTDRDWIPDRVVYNATKDQLKSMPEFRYNR